MRISREYFFKLEDSQKSFCYGPPYVFTDIFGTVFIIQVVLKLWLPEI